VRLPYILEVFGDLLKSSGACQVAAMRSQPFIYPLDIDDAAIERTRATVSGLRNSIPEQNIIKAHYVMAAAASQVLRRLHDRVEMLSDDPGA
jgi:hypothetical protein